MFKNRIREERAKRGLSQTALARMVSIAEPALSDLELGKRQPWPKVRSDLSRALNIPEAKLFPAEETARGK